MSAKIFYFTGTGNSLVVARDIAARLGGELVSIPSLMDRETIPVAADIVGIVCPAYHTRMPAIVARFIARLTDLPSKYIFAIVTVGGIAGGILERISRAVDQRGGRLAAGFIVRMPANYIHDANALPLYLQKRMFRNWRKKSDRVADYVRSGRRGLREKYNPIMTFLFSGVVERRYQRGDLNPDIDRYFRADEKCNGCGVCAHVCPVTNIEIVDERPVWQHRCEKCLSCIQWCPRESIQFKDVTLKRKRYHHPDVKLKDILRRGDALSAGHRETSP
jgi:ferredoxin/flavodoxin